jgi:hypothetical protein
VIIDVFLQLGEIVILPRGGLRLLARIGPGVAVVKIDHDAKAHRLGALGHFHDVVLAAPAAFRVDPDAEADGIDSLVLQDLQAILGLSVVAVKWRAGRFHFRQPADVGAFRKRRGGLGGSKMAEAGQEQPGEEDTHFPSAFGPAILQREGEHERAEDEEDRAPDEVDVEAEGGAVHGIGVGRGAVGGKHGAEEGKHHADGEADIEAHREGEKLKVKGKRLAGYQK